MKIKLYQIDAFTEKVFGGNPAAVCILEDWIEEELMQKIAAENNLSETAFVVQKEKVYEIRWFTPKAEVDLCGHATLATAHALFKFYDYKSDIIEFDSHTSGKLSVRRKDDFLTLDFPADISTKVDALQILIDAIGSKPTEAYKGKTDYVLIYQSQKDIEDIKPDFKQLLSANVRGVIISAPGEHTDFVSRFFAPQVGIDEDPVTGSAHTTLTPIWSNKLGKKVLTAKQLSQRQGYLECEYAGERVKITGKAVNYLMGEITV